MSGRRRPGGLSSPAVDAAALRARFPILERVAYLNAGTDGPVPEAALGAARAELEREVYEGRATAHFERRFELADRLRDAYAGLLGCESCDLALTDSTSEGIATALAGLDIRPGDEILTSDEEHPGLQGPLLAARDTRGATVRVVPFARLAEEVGPRTRVVATSHVSWKSGAFAPAELASAGVPVVLDGAQGIGAVPVDVAALGCAAYAGSGQKWLCGPDGTGMLYVAPDYRDEIAPTRPGYIAFQDPSRGLESAFHEDCRPYESFSLPAASVAAALAALEVLASLGWDAVHARGAALAEQLAGELRSRGRAVVDRDATTLVAWSSLDPLAERERLAAAGVVIRDLPGTGTLRASSGAWNHEGDLERLLAGLE